MAAYKIERWRTPDGLVRLEGWARDGLSYQQIANNCGISRRTLNHWRHQFPEIEAALEKGREVVEFEVENAIIKRALGYDYQETQVEVSEKNGRKVTETTRHAKPDVHAATFWLTHRSPEKFGRQPEVEAKPGGCILLPMVELSDPDGIRTPEGADQPGTVRAQKGTAARGAAETSEEAERPGAAEVSADVGAPGISRPVENPEGQVEGMPRPP